MYKSNDRTHSMINIIFEATLAQFEAQKAEALAELSIFFAGSQYDRDELMNAVRKLNEAEKCIQTLHTNFIEPEEILTENE